MVVGRHVDAFACRPQVDIDNFRAVGFQQMKTRHQIGLDTLEEVECFAQISLVDPGEDKNVLMRPADRQPIQI